MLILATYDLIIRNGNVVLPDKVKKTDMAIKDGIIVAIEDDIPDTSKEERNADGYYIFPGLIDIHVHFNDPGRAEWEGFASGSQMIAAGGGTTFFDMPLNGVPSTTDTKALLEKVEIAESKSVVDFALWGGLVPGNIHELKGLADNGAIGFKAFLSESGNEEFERVDDLTLIAGMKEIASLKKILALHAESATITDFLTKEKVTNGHLTADDYLASRPIAAEVEAVERAIAYARITGCPLHFVHISSEEAIKKITAAKAMGQDISVETCAHYLLFNHNDLKDKGAIAKCAPPLRKSKEQEKLIRLLIEGEIDMVSSDHSPSPFMLKDPTAHHLFSAWGGISGGQFTLLALIELAITYEIPFNKVAALIAGNPAERFNLKTKGHIEVGKDADITWISLEESYTVSEKNFFAKHKQSLYMKRTFPCAVKLTMNRGSVVFENGQLVNRMEKGQWIKPQETKMSTSS